MILKARISQWQRNRRAERHLPARARAASRRLSPQMRALFQLADQLVYGPLQEGFTHGVEVRALGTWNVFFFCDSELTLEMDLSRRTMRLYSHGAQEAFVCDHTDPEMPGRLESLGFTDLLARVHAAQQRELARIEAAGQTMTYLATRLGLV